MLKLGASFKCILFNKSILKKLDQGPYFRNQVHQDELKI